MRTILGIAAFGIVSVGVASAQYQCKKTFDDFVPPFAGDQKFPSPLIGHVSDFDLYTNGVYVGSLRISNIGDLWKLTINGVPYTSDPDNPGAYYDAAQKDTLFSGICSGGLSGLGAAVAHLGSLPAAAPNKVSGQAAGLYVNGDFNGDGNIDSAQSGAGKVVVSIYNSAGKVAATNTYTVGKASGPIVAGDFNGDGKIDLAAIVTDSSGQQGSVAVLIGKGDGTFASPVSYPMTAYPLTLAAADFNKDGKLDLAVGGQSGTTLASAAGAISILTGNGDGTFLAGATLTAGKVAQSIVAADLNNDGSVDLAVLDPGVSSSGASLWALLGNGNGTFHAAIGGLSGTGQGSLSYADVNQDGKLDILVADFDFSAVDLLAGNGDGTFQAVKMNAASAQPASIAPIPLGDGSTALFTGDAATGNLMFSLSDPTGRINGPSIQTIGKKPGGIAVADLNGDGKPDIVWLDYGGAAVDVLLNSGGGMFAAPVSYSLAGAPSAVAVADVNGDGKLDVIVQDSSGVEVLFEEGAGTFGQPQGSAASAGPSLSTIATGDFNGDGKIDVAVLNGNGGVSILLGNGSGTFAVSTALTTGGGASTGLAAADFNGDRKIDLAVSYNSQGGTQPGAVMVLLGDGQGGFRSSSATFSLAGQAMGLAAADLNGDGKADLVARAFAPASLTVALGKGDGTFQTSQVKTVTAGPVVAIADLNGDKIPDLVLSDCCGLSEASYLFGNGDGTFSLESQFTSGSQPQFVAAGDLDGDGMPDLVLAGSGLNRGTLVLARNVFATVNALSVASAAGGVSALAPGSLASSYGSDLATGQPSAPGLPWPPSVNGTSVTIVDSKGVSSTAPLTYVSAGQLNFEIPDSVATGAATVTVRSGDGTVSATQVTLTPMAPALFTLNSANLAAAYVICVSSSGAQSVESPFQVLNGALVAQPVNLGACAESVLELYGTGMDAANATGTQVTIGGVSSQVLYAGPGGGFPGLDQINVVIPQSLAGAGNVTIALTSGGVKSNSVTMTVQ